MTSIGVVDRSSVQVPFFFEDGHGDVKEVN